MTTPKNEAFKNLFTTAVNCIANLEGKNTAIVEEELGDTIGVAGKTIQRYKSGRLPPKDHERDAIRTLAKIIIEKTRGLLSRKWLENFLRAARCFDPELLDELCPIPTTEPKLERIYQNLPRPTYSRFVMREQAFAEIADGIERRSAVVLISSLGGMGKTSLALEFAKRSFQSASDMPHFDAAVWVSDQANPGTTNLSIVLDKIAQTLDYPGFTEYEHREKQNKVEQLLYLKRILLVVDNFETITDGMLLEWLLRLPEPSKAIITTREYRREFRNSAIQVELKRMTDSEAWELINERLEFLGMPTTENYQTQLAPLLEATGGNPKALDITMGLLKYERRPLQQVIDEMYAAQGEVFDNLFRRSWELLDESAKRVLLVSTFFVDTINREALASTSGVHGPDFERVIEQLTDLALLDHVQQMNLNSVARYTLHPLVRSFATSQLVKQPEFEREARERWVEWYKSLAYQIWNEQRGQLQSIPLFDEEHLTATAGMEWAMSQGLYQEAYCLSNALRFYYLICGPFDRKIYVNIRQIEAMHHLDDWCEKAHAYSSLIQSLCTSARLDNARKWLREMIQQFSSVSPLNEILFWINYTHAIVETAEKHFDVAQQKLQLCLSYAETMRPSIRGDVRRRLAESYSAQGNWNSAEIWYFRALDIAIEHRMILGIVRNKLGLVQIYIHQEQEEKASNFLKQCIDEYPNYPDRSGRGRMMQHSGQLHTLRGELTEAHAALTEAIDLFERMGMPNELAESQEELIRLEAQITTNTD